MEIRQTTIDIMDELKTDPLDMSNLTLTYDNEELDANQQKRLLGF